MLRTNFSKQIFIYILFFSFIKYEMQVRSIKITKLTDFKSSKKIKDIKLN